MDFRHPVESMIPGARGRLLGVLSRTTRELTLRGLADLAAVSPSQASRVLAELVNLGVVQRRDVPPAALFVLAREHAAAQVIESLATLRDTVLTELKRRARQLSPQPTNVTVFGSFARGEADSESDLDLLVVRPEAISEDDAEWSEMLVGWVAAVGAFTGNPVNIVESDDREIVRHLRAPKGLWRAVFDEGELLTGTRLEQLGRALRA